MITFFYQLYVHIIKQQLFIKSSTDSAKSLANLSIAIKLVIE